MDDLLEQRTAAELRAELRRQDRTGRWLSEQTGLSPSSVARWLKGTRSPGLNELDLMCQALGLTVADLLHRIDVNGGYARTPVLALVGDDGENRRTSDQKARGSNPFGCTRREEVLPQLPDRRARRGRRFVTLPLPITAGADLPIAS